MRLRRSSRKWPDPKRKRSARPSAPQSARPPARYSARLGPRRRPVVSLARRAAEALAMAAFISVQLKKTSEVDLAKPLVKFIQQTYPSGGEEQAQYCRAAEELSKLRRAALGRPLDKHEGALETLLRWAWGRVGGGWRRPAACLASFALPDSFTPTAGPAAPPRLGPARRCGLHSFLLQAPVTLPASPGCPPPSSGARSTGHLGGTVHHVFDLLPHLPRTSFLHFFFF